MKLKQIVLTGIICVFNVFLCACGGTESSAESVSNTPKYNCDIHIDFLGNLIFSKYDVELYIDDEYQDTLEHGEDADLEYSLTEGIHALKFQSEDSSSVNGTVELDVTSDLEAAYKISCSSDEVDVETLYVDYKVELESGKSKVTKSAEDFEYGEDYEDVVAELTEMGFTNIQTKPVYDIVLGITSEGEYAEITIDGNSDFTKGEIFSSDAEVIVTYHMNESSDPEAIAQKQAEEEQKQKEAEEAAKKEEEMNTILTVDNCEDLAKLLSSSSGEYDYFAEFASKYSGRKIEFDASIDDAFNESKYVYDILLTSGDYNLDVSIGPVFKFDDTSAGAYESDTTLSVGMNVHVIAEVRKFDDNLGLFFLDPEVINGR